MPQSAHESSDATRCRRPSGRPVDFRPCHGVGTGQSGGSRYRQRCSGGRHLESRRAAHPNAGDSSITSTPSGSPREPASKPTARSIGSTRTTVRSTVSRAVRRSSSFWIVPTRASSAPGRAGASSGAHAPNESDRMRRYQSAAFRTSSDPSAAPAEAGVWVICPSVNSNRAWIDSARSLANKL